MIPLNNTTGALVPYGQNTLSVASNPLFDPFIDSAVAVLPGPARALAERGLKVARYLGSQFSFSSAGDTSNWTMGPYSRSVNHTSDLLSVPRGLYSGNSTHRFVGPAGRTAGTAFSNTLRDFAGHPAYPESDLFTSYPSTTQFAYDPPDSTYYQNMFAPNYGTLLGLNPRVMPLAISWHPTNSSALGSVVASGGSSQVGYSGGGSASFSRLSLGTRRGRRASVRKLRRRSRVRLVRRSRRVRLARPRMVKRRTRTRYAPKKRSVVRAKPLRRRKPLRLIDPEGSLFAPRLSLPPSRFAVPSQGTSAVGASLEGMGPPLPPRGRPAGNRAPDVSINNANEYMILKKEESRLQKATEALSRPVRDLGSAFDIRNVIRAPSEYINAPGRFLAGIF